MAPTQTDTSEFSALSGNSSATASQNNKSSRKSSLEGRTSSMGWSEDECLLPIATRGKFYNDAIFEDARKNFDQAVKEVLDQRGARSGQGDDDLTSYRKMRELDPQDNNQAVSVSQDDKNHKVVLDVRDFMRGDVKVKVIDENELVVDGSCEKQDGGSVSKRSFQRSFTFPGLVKADVVSSAMSSDGVLTVTVPKNIPTGTSSVPINSQGTNIRQSTESGSNYLNQTGSSQHKDRFNSDNFFEDFKRDISLPVENKGLFFQDSFFDSARKDFENSVQDVLSRSGETESANRENNMSNYRSLRERNSQQDNQAISVTEDNDNHKVVIDAKDFMHNDLKVKIVDENELVVEGKMEKQEGGSVSSKTFCRSFAFPGLVNSEAVSSSMSSDGILIITVPKNKGQRSPQYVHSITKDNANVNTASQNQKHTNSNQSLQHDALNSSRFMSDLDKQFSNNSLRDMAADNHMSVSRMSSDFHDDFFAKARQEFENASKDVFSYRDPFTSSTDERSLFKDLQIRTSGEDNMSVNMTEDNHSHKVEIDVREFSGGKLQVKALEQNELLVEGHLERDENGRSCNKSFSRRIQLPGNVKVDEITSVLSREGVLAITAPKSGSSKFF